MLTRPDDLTAVIEGVIEGVIDAVIDAVIEKVGPRTADAADRSAGGEQ
jgi:hypothetical protein